MTLRITQRLRAALIALQSNLGSVCFRFWYTVTTSTDRINLETLMLTFSKTLNQSRDSLSVWSLRYGFTRIMCSLVVAPRGDISVRSAILGEFWWLNLIFCYSEVLRKSLNQPEIAWKKSQVHRKNSCLGKINPVWEKNSCLEKNSRLGKNSCFRKFLGGSGTGGKVFLPFQNRKNKHWVV